MARRKRSPTSIRWNHRGLSQQVGDADKCLSCTAQAMNGADPKSPVEKEDYFMDSDGTLTIKNGICPRKLALTLLTELSHDSSRFEADMGKHISIFILNLEQILKSHNLTCPGETATQLINAESFIQAYKTSQKILLSQSRKRHHDDGDLMISEPLRHNMANLTTTTTTLPSDIPDNFLAIPEKEARPSMMAAFPDIPLTIDCDSNNNSTIRSSANIDDDDDDDDDDDHDMDKGMVISEGNLSEVMSPSSGMTSQVPSPSPGTPLGMTVAEAAIANKQMSNTKRGSKILPLGSSTDGLVKYNCPICSLELSGDHELTVHIRSHNQTSQQTTPNSCTICGKILSSQSSLDRHMLVHSGERPFRCKICDMSFTTNGNMHRHSRIHQKNGINIKTPGRKTAAESKLNTDKSPSSLPSSSPSPSSVTGSQAHLTALMAGYIEPDSSAASRSSHRDQNAEFLQYLNELNKIQQMTRGYLYPFHGAHHSAFPYSPLMPDPLTYMQAMIDPATGEPLNKRICLPHRVMPHPREPSPDLRAAKRFDCPECKAVFKSQFSLESHMECHVIVDKKLEAEGGAACKTCKIIAKSEESLLLHTLTHHKVAEDMTTPDSSSPPPSPSDAPTAATLRNKSSKTVEKREDSGGDAPASFMDLGFADFTTKKFPLIAKAFCEDNLDLKANTFPVYKCQECDKTFPVEGAKDLHEASHVPEEYTQCPKCNCHFSDSSRLQEHMLKHVSDMKFEKSLEEKEGDGNTSMTQNYFLAQFGLITAEDHGTVLNCDQMEQEEDDKDMSVNPSEVGSMDTSIHDTAESVTSNDAHSQMADSDSHIMTLPIKAEDMAKIRADKSEKSSLPNLDTLQDSKSFLDKSLSSERKIESNSAHVSSPFLISGNSQERFLPPSFQCKHCNVILSSAKAFKHHQSIHKDTQQFQCKVCPYSSTDKSTLLRHMRTHNGERPYKCKLCDYSFTTKANCERHLRQKHGMQHKGSVKEKEKLIQLKFDLQDIIQTNRKAGGAATEKSSATMCASCGIDFHQYHSLQQHLHNSPDCRMVFACKSCKMTFPTKQGISQHLSKKHADVPPHLISQLVSSVENGPNSDTTLTPELSTPPPAHSVTKSESKITLDDIDKATSSRLLKSYLMSKPKFNTPFQLPAPDIIEANKPLDFSSKKSTSSDCAESTSAASSTDMSVTTHEQSIEISEDEPMDLSVSRPSTSPSLSKVEDNQIPLALLVRKIKDEPQSPTKSNSETSDGNNNQISMLFPNPKERSSLVLALSQQSQRAVTNPDVPIIIPASQLPKHPAFPQFLPVILPQLSGRLQILPKTIPDSSTSSLPTASKTVLGIPTEISPFQLGRSLLAESGGDVQLMQPSIVLEDLKKESKKLEKGSSSESESSCELASVNKMLHATDAQNFQDYLMIPETEDEQDNSSKSDDVIESEEDSNMSMENMYSNSQSFNSGLDTKSEKMDKPPVNSKNFPGDSKKGVDDSERIVTVGMALLEGGIPTTVFKDTSLVDSIGDKIDIPDPSNMSEQEIAKLIEKVSKENANYPIKKKRNSYADSPHKFTCPYCPRCFPWLSSLNRHLLTHTGQKPFKCPRCPVTFSTKSNRERHLIRKHNVNMLDPASRSTMDRPYKCHLCVFSSFATQSNLIKHYKERHDGATPPLKALEAIDMLDKSLSDTEDDVNGKTCEEEEEEYALTQIHNGNLTDQDLMLQNYMEEDDSLDSAIISQLSRDPHKKRNAIFDLLPDNDIVSRDRYAGRNGLREHLSLSSGTNGKVSSSSPKLPNLMTLPGIDETVLTDNMKAFLGKSIQQSLEDSQRKALEEGSTFNITPAIERHMRRFPKSISPVPNQSFQCVKCDEQFATKKQLLNHFKTHILEMPFHCYLCEMTFATRLECLQHQTRTHISEWQTLQEKNGIGNLAVFAHRLDKGVVKICKKGKDIMDRMVKPKSLVRDDDSNSKEVPSTENGGKEIAENESNEQENENEPTTKILSDLKDDSNRPVGEENLVNNFLNEVLSTDYLQRKVHCSLCPKRFWSQHDLKKHMKIHTAKSGKDDVSQEKPSDDVPSSKDSVSLTVKSQVENKDEKKEKEKEKTNIDILHNLLGVESATIDQIFDSKDTAASLLGVNQNSKS